MDLQHKERSTDSDPSDASAPALSGSGPHGPDVEASGDIKPGKTELSASRASDSEEDGALTVEKQMELEAGNAIKYRTCSWQKVSIACKALKGLLLLALC